MTEEEEGPLRDEIVPEGLAVATLLLGELSVDTVSFVDVVVAEPEVMTSKFKVEEPKRVLAPVVDEP